MLRTNGYKIAHTVGHRLSKIYTRTGDDGTTSLGDLSRTDKGDLRLVAYADVDEANSALGVALALGDLPADLGALLTRVQNELFDVGADLSVPFNDGVRRDPPCSMWRARWCVAPSVRPGPRWPSMARR